MAPLASVLLPCAGLTYAIQAAVGVPSTLAHTEKLYDLSGGVTFLAVTGLSLYLPALRRNALAQGIGNLVRGGVDKWGVLGGGAWHWRQLMLVGMVGVWSMRLSTYLFTRILHEGRDSRFDRLKHTPRFLIAWTAQATWVFVSLLPVMAVNALPPAALAGQVLPEWAKVGGWIGLGLWGLGMVTEVVADEQKKAWKKDREEKRHEEEFMTRGIWNVCRFPHYLGEITLWSGVAVSASAFLATTPAQLGLGWSNNVLTKSGAVALACASPAFAAFVLLKVTGVPLSEKKYDKRFKDDERYQRWRRETPMILPRLW